MPVVKSEQSTPMVKNAIVLDLSDVSQQAARIREEAQRQAQQIVAEAKQQAAELVKHAAANGETQGREQGYKQGYETGFAEGEQKGYDEAYEKTRQTLAAVEQPWIESAQQWDNFRTELDEQTRQSILELALRLTDRIIQRTIEMDPTIIADQLTIALRQITGVTSVRVHVCPDDRPLLEDLLPNLINKFDELDHVELIEDESISRGGCIIRHESGKVDVTIDTQLRRVVELMLPDVELQEPAEQPLSQATAIAESTMEPSVAVDEVAEPAPAPDAAVPDESDASPNDDEQPEPKPEA